MWLGGSGNQQESSSRHREDFCVYAQPKMGRKKPPTTGTGFPEEAARAGAELAGVSLTPNSGTDSPHPTTSSSAPSSKTLSSAGLFYLSSSCSPFRCPLFPFSISSAMSL